MQRRVTEGLQTVDSALRAVRAATNATDQVLKSASQEVHTLIHYDYFL